MIRKRSDRSRRFMDKRASMGEDNFSPINGNRSYVVRSLYKFDEIIFGNINGWVQIGGVQKVLKRCKQIWLARRNAPTIKPTITRSHETSSSVLRRLLFCNLLSRIQFFLLHSLQGDDSFSTVRLVGVVETVYRLEMIVGEEFPVVNEVHCSNPAQGPRNSDSETAARTDCRMSGQASRNGLGLRLTSRAGRPWR